VFDNYIKGLTIMLGWPQHPSDLLTSRCLWRGASGKDLDAALDDCDQSLKQTPQNATALVNRGLVLYRQGKYQEAVAACDAALAADPKQARSFYLRGRSKAKLGDVTGGSSDMAAAQAMDPDTAPALQRMGFFLEPDSKAGSEQDTAKTAAKVSP
jgi:tetratricopeptide (TPR) repeat protein